MAARSQMLAAQGIGASARLGARFRPEDREERAGRWISLFVAIAGALAFAQSFAPVVRNAAPLRTMAAVALVTAALGLVIPWRRWGGAALRSVPPVVCAMIAFAIVTGANLPAAAGMFALLAVWIGLFRPPGSGWMAAPWIAAAWGGSLLWLGQTETVVRSSATTVAVGIIVAEVIARTIHALDRARAEAAGAATVLHATMEAARRLRTLRPEGVFREMTDAALSIGFEAAAVNVLDRDAGRFRVAAAFGFAESIEDFEQPATDGVSGRVLTTGKLVVASDYGNTEWRVRALDGESLTVVAGVPLVAGGEIAAVLLACGRARLDLPPWALDALELLACDAGIALENARAFETQRALTNEFAARALRDALTGLPNRPAADAELATLQDGDVVVIIDLDHFKAINDGDGHLAGDAVLRQVGAFLRTSLREDDFSARWGGEEFIVLLRGAGTAGEAVAERLLAAWRATRPRTTFSGGLAIHRAGRAPADTLQMADAALYRAKRLGRDRIAAAVERRAVA